MREKKNFAYVTYNVEKWIWKSMLLMKSLMLLKRQVLEGKVVVTG